VTLRAMVEEASELGAERVLAAAWAWTIPRRHGDLIELRQLLRAWRDAKASAWKAAVNGWCAGCWRCCWWASPMRLGADGAAQ
jgi:hypothetical protein